MCTNPDLGQTVLHSPRAGRHTHTHAHARLHMCLACAADSQSDEAVAAAAFGKELREQQNVAVVSPERLNETVDLSG